jgi:hypothetical protein
MWRGLNRLNPPLHRPFYLAPDFFPSPPKSFKLLVYVEPLAGAFATQHIADPVPQTKHLDPWVHELMDVEACESDRSTSHSMTASFSTTESEDGSTEIELWSMFAYHFMYCIIHSFIGVYYPLFH